MLFPAEKYTENQMRLLSLLRSGGPLTRAELSSRSGLSPLTVTRAAARFLEDNIVKTAGLECSTGGRKAARLGINGGFAYVLAADIGAYSVEIGAVNLCGTPIEKRVFALPEGAGYPSRIMTPAGVAGVFSELLEKHGHARCAGAGIGISGVVSKERDRVLFCPNISGWDGFSPGGLAESLRVPVFLDSSARCMALGERHYGAAREEENFILVSVGCSVAAGIFIDGRLFRGGGGAAGELGHTLAEKDGGLCTCKNRGCLELCVTVPMIRSRLRAPAGGDELAHAGESLGIALANMANLINPNMVLLAGGLNLAFPEVFLAAKEVLYRRVLTFSGEGLCILPAELGENCAVAGCAAQAINAFFGTE